MNPAPISQVYRAAKATAWVAGVFVLCVCAAMVYQRINANSNDPWKSPQLLELKAQLQAAPKDEAIKGQIRELDLIFRRRYSRRLTMVRTGGWLLLGGAIVLLASLTVATEARKVPPCPQPDHDAGDRALRQTAASRRAVAIAGGVVLVGMVAVSWGVRSALTEVAGPPPESKEESAAKAVAALPSVAEFMANWPRFRGPTGSGVAATADAPLTWDGKTGAGVLWKTAVPAPGFNSPIVWGDRLFVSGGTREKREVFCYETAGGKLLWQRAVEQVPGSPAEAPEISDQTGYAASTMATDGRRAYVMFATGDVAALTFDGAIVWSKNLGVPKNLYGHATSLAVWEGRLLVQFDQGESGPANSRLMALNGATGRVVWEKVRQMPSSWATPIVAEAAGRIQIITLGVPFVVAYAPADGRELWRAEVLEGEVTPSPVMAGGLVLAINPSNTLLAIKADGTGEVGATHVSWKADDNIPDITSPVSNGELVFTVSGSGAIECHDLKDGAKVWAHDLRTEVQASPSIAGNRLYLLCLDGTTVVAEAGRTFKELARNELGEKFMASPAFAPGRIYLRGLTHLYCLAGGTSPPANPGP